MMMFDEDAVATALSTPVEGVTEFENLTILSDSVEEAEPNGNGV